MFVQSSPKMAKPSTEIMIVPFEVPGGFIIGSQ